MKKKILIVNKSFTLGGIQTSLINMLKEIKDDYEIDLLVYYNEGALKDKIPEGINVIKPSMLVSTLGMALIDLKRCKNPFQIVFRLFAAVWTKLFSNSFPVSLALLTQKNVKGYDTAIAFHHETNSVLSGFSQIILRRTDAKKKIGWIHADILKAGLISPQIRKTYSQLDKIVCVSKSAMESFLTCFPELKDKCDYCYNFNPYKEIIEKSNEQNNVFNRRDSELLVFTACRFSAEKGLLRAIRAVARLINEGYQIKWYIAGDGIEKENIINEIKKYSLQNTILLLGMLSNPYPYMREADLLLISSLHEAAPMVIDEAQIVGIPVLSTDMPIISEKVTNEGGFICKNSEEGIYLGLKQILDNPEKLLKSKLYLSKRKYTNEDSIRFLSELIQN